MIPTPPPTNHVRQNAGNSRRHINYDISIESLVMHGITLAPWQANEFRTALEAELAAQISVPDSRPKLLRSTAAGNLTVHLGAADSPAEIARAVARSMFGKGTDSRE
jgi:hypothetical protein